MFKKISLLSFALVMACMPTWVMATGLPKVLVISSSLDPKSKSALVAKIAYEMLAHKKQEVESEFLDLRQFSFPTANGHEQSAYDHADVKWVHDKIASADAIILTVPIYNYTPASTTKNLIELTNHKHKEILSGKAWQGKVVAFISNAGSPASQLAFMPLMNSLFLDAGIHVVPAYVFTSTQDFKENKPSSSIEERLKNMVQETVSLTKALAQKA